MYIPYILIFFLGSMCSKVISDVIFTPSGLQILIDKILVLTVTFPTLRLQGRPGGRRSTPQLEQRPLGSRPLCFCLFLCPLANWRMMIRFGGHYLVYRRLYPHAADFPFFRSKIGLHRPAVRRRSSSTLPKDEVVAAPSRLQQRRS